MRCVRRVRKANLLHFSELGSLEAETSGRIVRGADPDAAPNQDVDYSRERNCRTSVSTVYWTCSHYLLTVDASRDPSAAYRWSTQLAAFPYYVYAGERGLSKIVANQLGF